MQIHGNINYSFDLQTHKFAAAVNTYKCRQREWLTSIESSAQSFATSKRHRESLMDLFMLRLSRAVTAEWPASTAAKLEIGVYRKNMRVSVKSCCSHWLEHENSNWVKRASQKGLLIVKMRFDRRRIDLEMVLALLGILALRRHVSLSSAAKEKLCVCLCV
jgi:hypothetical protein